jgi:hypothetical protein
MPAGFTKWAGDHSSTDYRFDVGWKRASGESGDYTFGGGSGCTAIIAAISVYRNCVITGDPSDIYNLSAYNTANTNVRGSGFSSNVAINGIYVWVGYAQGAAQTLAVPSGFTSRVASDLENSTRLNVGDLNWPVGTISTSKYGIAGVSTAIKCAMAIHLAEQGAIFKAIAVGA